jgi:hypothetical protein
MAACVPERDGPSQMAEASLGAKAMDAWV